MENNDITNDLKMIFRSVFNDPNLELTDDLTAKDVERWDSLTHMILIDSVEKKFKIKFKLRDLNKMRNVGDMKAIIKSLL